MINDNYVEDVEFQEVTKNNENSNNIRGTALYYSTSQVASILGTTDSRIRYYAKEFADILHIETSNKQKRYKQEDIDKLKFIIELKNEKMTLNQIKEYCEEVDFQQGEITVKETNPLGIQALAKALMEEQTKQIENLKTELFEQIVKFIENQNSEQRKTMEDIKEDICIAVDDVVNDRINASINDLKETFKASYITKSEIENIKNKQNWFNKIFKTWK